MNYTKKSICLIGMPGVGKTSIGKKLAKKLQFKFTDTDTLLLNNTTLTLQELINDLGENHIKSLEEEIVLNLNFHKSQVISTGGSVIYSKKSMKYLSDNSLIIYLYDSVENIKNRITNFSTRGIIGLDKKSFSELYMSRSSLYEDYSDRIYKIKRFNINIIVEELLEVILNYKDEK